MLRLLEIKNGRAGYGFIPGRGSGIPGGNIPGQVLVSIPILTPVLDLAIAPRTKVTQSK